MSQTNANRRRFRICVEPLELRELLSGSPSQHANMIGDASPETAVAITLHLGSSSAPAGDFVDLAPKHVVLTGQTSAGATVVVGKTLASGKFRTVAKTHAGHQGTYKFMINCGMGTTRFTAHVVGAAGVASSPTLSVTRANQAIVWNSIALQAVRTAQRAGPDASRVYAIVALSVYDAVNAIDPRVAHTATSRAAVFAGDLGRRGGRRRGGDRPGRPLPAVSRPCSVAELNATLSAIPAGRGRNLGIALGTSVANQILALRSHDGSNVKVQLRPGHGTRRLGADSSGLRPGR